MDDKMKSTFSPAVTFLSQLKGQTANYCLRAHAYVPVHTTLYMIKQDVPVKNAAMFQQAGVCSQRDRLPLPIGNSIAGELHNDGLAVCMDPKHIHLTCCCACCLTTSTHWQKSDAAAANAPITNFPEFIIGHCLHQAATQTVLSDPPCSVTSSSQCPLLLPEPQPTAVQPGTWTIASAAVFWLA